MALEENRPISNIQKSSKLVEILRKLEKITARQNQYQAEYVTAQLDQGKDPISGADNFAAKNDLGLQQGRRLGEISGMISDIKSSYR